MDGTLLKKKKTEFKQTLKILERDSDECYNKFLRISTDDFRFLLEKIKFPIDNKNIFIYEMQFQNLSCEWLTLSLRFLATGK